MSNTLIEHAARAVAQRLAAEHGSGLRAEVEAALHARSVDQRPTRYLDPISLGSLIVSVASLTWTVYADLRRKTQRPSAEVVARRVRVELPASDNIQPAQRDQIIDIVVDQIVKDSDE